MGGEQSSSHGEGHPPVQHTVVQSGHDLYIFPWTDTNPEKRNTIQKKSANAFFILINYLWRYFNIYKGVLE